jgi:hypothetical protein
MAKNVLADLRDEAEQLSPVITAAAKAVSQYSQNIDDGGAFALANSLAQAQVDAQRTLVDVNKFPAARRDAADRILADAEEKYSTWREVIGTLQEVYTNDLLSKLKQTPTGTDALIARKDAEFFLRNDKPLPSVFASLVRVGGAVAQLAVSPWLETVCAAYGEDPKPIRTNAELLFVQQQADSGNKDAQLLRDAPAAYGKVVSAMGTIASEMLGTNRSAFAKRALSWGDPTLAKDQTIANLQAQIARLEGKRN